MFNSKKMNTENFEQRTFGLEICWMGSFPLNLSLEAAWEKPKLTDGRRTPARGQ